MVNRLEQIEARLAGYPDDWKGTVAGVPFSAKDLRLLLRVVRAATGFWETTDNAPLVELTSDQGFLWDELCDALRPLRENTNPKEGD